MTLTEPDAGVIRSSVICVFPNVKLPEAVTVAPVTVALALIIPAEPINDAGGNPDVATTTEATPLELVRTVPDAGSNPVPPNVSAKVTNVFGTGLPPASNTVALAVNGQDAVTVLTGVQLELNASVMVEEAAPPVKFDW